MQFPHHTDWRPALDASPRRLLQSRHGRGERPISSSRMQTVIVTGGATGIGRAVASAFAEQRARVVIVGRREGELRAAAEALGPSVTWHRADIGDREQVLRVIERAVAESGPLDVLVNNAGFVRSVA